MAEIKEPIRIRRKKLTNGNVSLYLDIYLNGKREYEFLKLYLIPEKTKADREANRQTLQLANSIKARRIVEVQNGEHGFKSAYASDTLFFDYYRAMCARRLGAESTGNWGELEIMPETPPKIRAERADQVLADHAGMGAGISGLFRERCVRVELRRAGSHQGSSAVSQFTGQLLQ